MTKQRTYTRRHLHAARLRAERTAKVREGDSSFRYRHDAEMRKMLKGIDLDRFEALADGRLP